VAFRAAATGASIAVRRAARTGATVSYIASQPGTTTFTVLRSLPGIRGKGNLCLKPKKGQRGAACRRYRSAGVFTHATKAGANSLHFTGRLRGRKLLAGSYRLQAVPRASAGASGGAAVTVAFRILG
jgi:hypothetical protein